MIAIDLIYIIYCNLAPTHQIIEIVDYMKSAMRPLTELQDQFYLFFDQKKDELTWNGQVIMLEHLLNREFDPIDNQIYITDGDQSLNVYLFNDGEDNEQVFVYNNAESSTPVYLFNQAQLLLEFDFIVNVPATLTFNENLMRFYLDKYKVAGKRYKIELI